MSSFADPTLNWGAGNQMSDVEAMMYRVEVDPSLRSTGVVLDLLDRAPDWERLRAAHDWAARRASRLHQRVVDDPLHVGPPEWVDCEVDLDYHLRRMRVPEGAGSEAALEHAAIMHMAPFDSGRPLWEAMLIEGLPNGRAAYLLKINHAIADGMGTVQLFDLVHSDQREPTDAKQAPAEAPARERNATDVLAKHVGDRIKGLFPDVAKLVLETGATALRTARDPKTAVAFTRSLARVTGDAPGTPSPALTTRGGSRTVRAYDVPLTALKAAAKGGGGSLNDAFLAGLAGGMGRYHAALGEPVGDLPMALPVSLRKADQEAGGNAFAGARIALPAGELDPVARIDRIKASVRAARDEPALDFLGFAAPVMSRMPTAVQCTLTAQFTRSIDLQASNFPGLRRDAYLAGAKIERMYPFGALPGPAVMAVLITHGDMCCVALTIDRSAVTDPDLLTACMVEGTDEVLALGSDVRARLLDDETAQA